MPNLDSTGKFGRSMDCSQLLDVKKKYKTIQQQNGKTPQGDQSQKPAFNSDLKIGGDSRTALHGTITRKVCRSFMEEELYSK